MDLRYPIGPYIAPSTIGRAERDICIAELDALAGKLRDAVEGFTDEDTPTIKPIEETAWAELPDAKSGPIEPSLALTDALHRRWVMLFRSLQEDDFQRSFRHPNGGEVTIDWTLGYFAWHSRHHVAHILNLRKREGW